MPWVSPKTTVTVCFPCVPLSVHCQLSAVRIMQNKVSYYLVAKRKFPSKSYGYLSEIHTNMNDFEVNMNRWLVPLNNNTLDGTSCLDT